MEALTRKERRLQNRDFRKAATVVFIGMILYLFLNFLAQSMFAATYIISKGIVIDPAAEISLIDTDPSGLGWIANAAAATAGTLIWLYFGLRKHRALAFPEQTELQAVFGRDKRITVKTVLLAMCAIFAIQLLFVLIFSGLERLFNLFGKTLAGSAAMETDYAVTASMLLYAALIGPFFEELIFRGFVMKGLKQYGKVFAILTSALCFALMHADFQQVCLTFFMGLIFGYIAMEYSVFWSFVLHVFNNYVLGELWGSFIGSLGESTQDIICFSLLAILLATCVLFCYRNRNAIRAYLIENKTAKGTYPVIWCSVWLIGFTVVQVFKTMGTIYTLHP